MFDENQTSTRIKENIDAGSFNLHLFITELKKMNDFLTIFIGQIEICLENKTHYNIFFIKPFGCFFLNETIREKINKQIENSDFST